MVQPRLTSFLSPVSGSTGPCSQSLPCGQGSPAPTPASSSDRQRVSDSPVQPKRKTVKSKKVIRAEKKAQRKRDKLNKRTNSRPSLPNNSRGDETASTPAHGTNDSAAVSADNDLSFLNMSLSEMLTSDADSTHGDITPASDRIIELESQLVASAISLEGEKNEVARLKQHISLLEEEYDKQKRDLASVKKVMNKQKDEIKKLTRSNDTLRREISRHTGIRKFTCDTKDNFSEMCDDHNKFRKEIANIATSLIDALDTFPEPNGFVTVTGRKLESQSNDTSSDKRVSDPASNSLSYSRAVSDPHTNSIRHRASRPISATPSHVNSHPSHTARVPLSSPTETIGQPIPVQLGIGANQAQHLPNDRGQATQHHRRTGGHQSASGPGTSTDETVIIGTSLINGLSAKVNSLGVPTTSYMYRGAQVPHIQSQIRHILNPGKQPKRVVLQCGGNDIERQSAETVCTRIETLVGDIRRLCPNSDILINKVPPRGRNQKVLNTVDKLNACLDRRYRCDEHVAIIDVCPKSPHFFRRDMVHFNAKGVSQFAENLADILSNFYWWDKRMWL